MVGLADLVDQVKATVVNVEVVSRVRAPEPPGVFPDDGLAQRFFGGRLPRAPREQVRQGQGSGFIIRPDGLALTNHHVVDGADVIRVRLDDGRSLSAKVLGRDPLTDVALIKIESEEALPAAKFGDSDALRVGDAVLAIGNPFGLASSVSSGILSAKARKIGAGPYDDFLQTDAAINPGNSGGPLFNMRGEVIGMNTAIIGGGTGIGFAVPSNFMKALVPQLEGAGEVTRGWLGVMVQDLTPALAAGLGSPARKGALVSAVNDGSPAQRAGVQADDVIVAVDGDEVDSSSALTRKVSLQPPGRSVQLTLYRGSARQTRAVTLGTRPNLEGLAPQERSDRGGGGARGDRHGLTFETVPEAFAARRGLPPGVQVLEVAPGSPAEQAELQPGMIIVEAAGRAIRTADDLDRVLSSARRGDVVLLRIHVGGGRVLRALPVPE